MKMKIILIIVLLSTSNLFAQSKLLIVVTDYQSNLGLGSDIHLTNIDYNDKSKTYIDSIYYEGKTNEYGFCKIEGIKKGKYYLYVETPAYNMYKDTIIVSDDNQIISKNITQKIVRIYNRTTAEIENYHDYFEKRNKYMNLIIRLDSLQINELNDVIVFSSFYNLSDSSIFVFRDYRDLRVIKRKIEDYKNNIIEANMFYSNDVGYPSNPGKEDFIEIKPQSKIDYPPISFELFFFEKLPAEEFKLSIKYSYSKPKFTNDFFLDESVDESLYSDIVYRYNMVFRQEVISRNYLIFNNALLSKLKNRPNQQINPTSR